MKADMSYWRFVEEWHPKYCSDDRVLVCDILFRYLEKEDVNEDDKRWIAKEFERRNCTRAKTLGERPVFGKS